MWQSANWKFWYEYVWVSLKIQGKPRKAVLGNTYIAWSEKTRPPNISGTYNCSSASWTAIDAPDRKGPCAPKDSIATISTSPKLPSCELVDRSDSTFLTIFYNPSPTKFVAAHCTSLHLVHSTSSARTPCRPKDCVSWTMTSPSRIRHFSFPVPPLRIFCGNLFESNWLFETNKQICCSG